MKKTIMLFSSICIILLLAACNDDAANSDAAANEKEDLHEMSIMLDWYPNAVHSFLYVADQKGYFEEEGIKVDFQFPANPTDPLTLAASDKATLGLYYQPDVIMAKANEDIPIKSVATIVQEPLNHLVYNMENPIQSPKDLEGEKVGYPGIPINEALVKTMVEYDGGNYDKVEMINVEFELSASLVSNQVRAVSGMFVNHEVPLLQKEGYDVKAINPVDYGVPSYAELVVVTSENTWEKEKEYIEAFWRAATKGYDYMVEQEDEALQILLDNQNEANFPLDKDVEFESLQILLPKMKVESGFGSQEIDSWEETADWLQQYDLIKEIPDMNEIVVDLDL